MSLLGKEIFIYFLIFDKRVKFGKSVIWSDYRTEKIGKINKNYGLLCDPFSRGKITNYHIKKLSHFRKKKEKNEK